jgi:hypothetical protein
VFIDESGDPSDPNDTFALGGVALFYSKALADTDMLDTLGRQLWNAEFRWGYDSAHPARFDQNADGKKKGYIPFKSVYPEGQTLYHKKFTEGNVGNVISFLSEKQIGTVAFGAARRSPGRARAGILDGSEAVYRELLSQVLEAVLCDVLGRAAGELRVRVFAATRSIHAEGGTPDVAIRKAESWHRNFGVHYQRDGDTPKVLYDKKRRCQYVVCYTLSSGDVHPLVDLVCAGRSLSSRPDAARACRLTYEDGAPEELLPFAVHYVADWAAKCVWAQAVLTSNSASPELRERATEAEVSTRPLQAAFNRAFLNLPSDEFPTWIEAARASSKVASIPTALSIAAKAAWTPERPTFARWVLPKLKQAVENMTSDQFEQLCALLNPR